MIIVEPTLGRISTEDDSEVEVGPVGHSYRYRIGGYLSHHSYANAASARADGRRDQVIHFDFTLTPVTNSTLKG